MSEHYEDLPLCLGPGGISTNDDTRHRPSGIPVEMLIYCTGWSVCSAEYYAASGNSASTRQAPNAAITTWLCCCGRYLTPPCFSPQRTELEPLCQQLT